MKQGPNCFVRLEIPVNPFSLTVNSDERHAHWQKNLDGDVEDPEEKLAECISSAIGTINHFSYKKHGEVEKKGFIQAITDLSNKISATVAELFEYKDTNLGYYFSSREDAIGDHETLSARVHSHLSKWTQNDTKFSEKLDEKELEATTDLFVIYLKQMQRISQAINKESWENVCKVIREVREEIGLDPDDLGLKYNLKK